MEHAEILHRCFRCGYCKFPKNYQDLNCPSYLKYKFETFSPGGRMWLLRAFLNGEIQPTQRFSEILFSCAACGNCVEHCTFPKFKDELLDAIIAGRGELVKKGTIPLEVKQGFESIYSYGNPFKLSQAERGNWAEGLNLPAYLDQEYLFYVGCTGSYDEQGQKAARAVATLLQKFGVSFGILGCDEWCDGNEVRALGEADLFEHTAKKNIDMFRKAKIRNIITLSPHAFHVMKNEYPRLGGEFQVHHYSQVLAFLILNGAGSLTETPLNITFHDPCYLGRHNKEYETPRMLLGAIPGLNLLEMDRKKADALCCGGGGGNFFTDVLGGGPESPSRVRVREAVETGAQVLAVACPKCMKMLDDAVKAEQLEERLEVMDLAEITSRAVINC